MPSLATGNTSSDAVSTQLCPITFLASFPEWVRFTVKFLQSFFTTITSVSNFMVSVLSIVTAQSSAYTAVAENAIAKPAAAIQFFFIILSSSTNTKPLGFLSHELLYEAVVLKYSSYIIYSTLLYRAFAYRKFRSINTLLTKESALVR